MTDDSNRCWPGYEPVKGKKPHEQGSCRPKPKSELSTSEEKFRDKRKKQLDKWQAEHPHTRRSAAQHLHAPDEKPKGKKSAKKPTKKAVKKTSTAKRTK